MNEQDKLADDARRAMAEAEVRQEMQAEIEQRIEQKLAEGGGQPTPDSVNMVDDNAESNDDAKMN
jgi:hypothetical protein